MFGGGEDDGLQHGGRVEGAPETEVQAAETGEDIELQ